MQPHLPLSLRAINLWTLRSASTAHLKHLLAELLGKQVLGQSTTTAAVTSPQDPSHLPDADATLQPASHAQSSSTRASNIPAACSPAHTRPWPTAGRSLALLSQPLHNPAASHCAGLRGFSTHAEAVQVANSNSSQLDAGPELAASTASSAKARHSMQHTTSQQPGPSSLTREEQAQQALCLSNLISSLVTIPEAERLLQAHAQQMKTRHVAQFLMQLPTLQTDVDNAQKRLRTLARLTSASLHSYINQMRTKELIGCLWALAQLGYSPHGFAPRAVSRLVQGQPPLLAMCQGSELTRLAWAVATLKVLYGDRLHEPESAPPFTSIKLLGDRWRAEAPASSRRSDPWQTAAAVWPLLVHAALSQAHTLSGHDVSQMVWALATSGVYHKPLFAALAERAIHLCPGASATSSSAFPSTDALASMTFRERRLMYKQRRQAEQAEQQAAAAAALTSTSINSQIAKAASSKADALALATPAQHTPSKHKGLSSREAADIAWAYTSSRHRQPRLFAALANAVRHDQLSLGAEDLATLMWAYASWGFYDALLIECLLPRAVKLMFDMLPDQASRVMWSLATLQHQDAALVKRLSKVLSHWQAEGTELAGSQVSNLLWSLAVLPPQSNSAPHQHCVVQLVHQLGSTETVQQLTTPQLLRTFWAAASLVLTFKAGHQKQVAHVVAAVLDTLRTRSPTDVGPELLAPLHLAGLMLGSNPAFAQQVHRLILGDQADADDAASDSSDDDVVDDHHASSPAISAPVPSAATPVIDEDGVMDISYVQPLEMFKVVQRNATQAIEPDQSLLSQLAPAWAQAAHNAALEAAVSRSSQDDDGEEQQEAGGSRSSRLARRRVLSAKPNEQSSKDSNPLTGCVIGQPPRPTWLAEVQQALQDLGIPCEEGVSAVHGCVPVDLAVVTPTGKLGIVLAGRTQHSRSTPHTLLGHPQIALHLLRQDGWRVAVVPWFEWSLMHTDDEQYMYLLGLLEQAHVVVR